MRIFKTLLIVVAVCFAATNAVSQTPDIWLSSEARGKNFPQSEYITGFAPHNVGGSETKAGAVSAAQTEAKAFAASNIRTMIEGASESESKQLEVNGDFDFVSIYEDYSKQSYQAEIAGFQTVSYYDEAAGIAYGFAYVKRSDLISYYKSQINIQLNKASSSLKAASTAFGAGQKLKAKKYCENALEPIAKAEFAQDLLTAIDPSANEESLQLYRTDELKDEVVQKLIDLEQSIYVYIKCDESNFGTPTTNLSNKLKSILSMNQCSFTTDASQADYKLTIYATTRKHDVENQDFKFTYADVSVDLYSNYKKMSVFSDEFSTKEGSMTYETSGRNALTKSASKIWEEIKPWITK